LRDKGALLDLTGVAAGYGRIEVLHDIDLHVEEGEILAVVGANGAGKSTLLKVLSGVLKPSRGHVTFAGEEISGVSVERLVSRGVVQIPEGRQLFGPLSVEENLQLGAYSKRKRGRPLGEKLEEAFQLFPRLRERRGQQAGTLSGGEQQMLAVARALMAEPRLLLLDEPSMGLAPLVVRDIFGSLRALNSGGLTMVLVEQDARSALDLAQRAIVMERGRIALRGDARALLEDDQVRSIYLGRAKTGRGRRMETA
jgi:branched-chain amino acid transport system ATP-binding protein